MIRQEQYLLTLGIHEEDGRRRESLSERCARWEHNDVPCVTPFDAIHKKGTLRMASERFRWADLVSKVQGEEVVKDSSRQNTRVNAQTLY